MQDGKVSYFSLAHIRNSVSSSQQPTASQPINDQQFPKDS